MGRFRRTLILVACLLYGASLGGCAATKVEVEDVDLLLDCYFIPIDQPLDDCGKRQPGLIVSVAATAAGSLQDEVKRSAKLQALIEDWEKDRKNIAPERGASMQQEVVAAKYRIARGYYVFAYLTRLGAEELSNNAVNAVATATSVHTKLKSGVNKLKQFRDIFFKGGALGPSDLALAQTTKVDAFYDGFEAMFETKAATATRVWNFLIGAANIVNPADVVSRIRDGLRFAYEEGKILTYASAIRRDLFENFILSHKKDQTAGALDDAFFNRLLGAINAQCDRIGALAGIDEAADRKCG